MTWVLRQTLNMVTIATHGEAAPCTGEADDTNPRILEYVQTEVRRAAPCNADADLLHRVLFVLERQARTTR